jgi:exosortase B
MTDICRATWISEVTAEACQKSLAWPYPTRCLPPESGRPHPTNQHPADVEPVSAAAHNRGNRAALARCPALQLSTIHSIAPMPPASVSPGLEPSPLSRGYARPQAPAVSLTGLGVLAASLALLYLPTAWSLWHSLWQDRTHGHGPIVFAVVVWLFARGLRTQAGQPAHPQRPVAGGGLGWGLASVGAMLYVLGRSQALYVLEVFSALPLLSGLVLLCFGPRVLRALWFPLFFLLFLVPLPGSFIDAVTHPMKLGVSFASEWLLATLGYPVARSGVILTIGPYQMFVADACAGLTSLFMLEAFGLLYLNVVRHASALRNAILAILIVPISFVSNVLRVMLLCLITFHLGDAAGQGFLHDFSGLVLFSAALVLTVFADSAARALVRLRAHGPAKHTHSSPVDRLDDDGQDNPGIWPPVASWEALAVPLRTAGICAVAALIALGSSVLLAPRPAAAQSAGDIEAMLPKSFGQWVGLDRPGMAIDVLANEPGETTLNNPYDQVVNRVFRHPDGTMIELAVAYGSHQRQEVKIHQPELCFASQGFRITSRRDATFQRPPGDTGPTITGKHLYSEALMAKLAASYWIRIGTVYADSAWETRWEILKEGIRGRAVDGVLVRTTMVVGTADDATGAHQRMEMFLAELLASASPELRRALAK